MSPPSLVRPTNVNILINLKFHMVTINRCENSTSNYMIYKDNYCALCIIGAATTNPPVLDKLRAVKCYKNFIYNNFKQNLSIYS